jgi:methyltransferase family protein
MPDVDWNRYTWDRGYQWTGDGDEWSAAWGGARAHWFGSILPRINRFLPAHRVLEIAPGHGRWSQFLVKQCTEYFGVDLSETCIQACRRRFAAEGRAHFLTNDGKSLAMVPDGAIDFVFSYDSLVHAEIDVVREYMWQIVQKLTPTGVAYIHHSNGAGEGVDVDIARRNNRALSVSGSLVKELIEDCSGKVLVQEEVIWDRSTRIDCMTTFCAGGAFENCAYRLLKNDMFMIEATLVHDFQSPYDLA